jgi:hypothetical protein
MKGEAICYPQNDFPRGQETLWRDIQVAECKDTVKEDLLPLCITRIISSPLPPSYGSESLMKILGGN